VIRDHKGIGEAAVTTRRR